MNNESQPENLQPENNEERTIRESLKRCSPQTIDAALLFLRTHDPALANTIVIGILTRFLDPEQRPKLQGECDHLSLMEDLGVDSLTMVEIVMLVEEVLKISIKNEELRDLRTIGDVKDYVNAVARGLPPPARPLALDVATIASVMPHQPPFLFLQDAELRLNEARATYRISGQEYFLEGHFKDRPIFPASLQMEALGQLAVLFLLKGNLPGIEHPVDAERILFTACANIRCLRICAPGDALSLSIRPKRIKYPLAIFEGNITVNGEKAAFAEEISLTFDYIAETPADEQPTGADFAEKSNDPSA